MSKKSLIRVPYNYLDKQFNPEGKLVTDILAGIKRLVGTGAFTIGPQVKEFEEQFARLCEVKHAIGINSGTDALILILKALGIGPGDEVITVPNSFIATANVILFVGARPVFVDTDEEYLMDVDKVANAITKKTKAILPVHLTGNPADIPRLSHIINGSPIYTIEDAAQAVDAEIFGHKAGGFGTAAEFSLHPLKNLNVWGDGGVVTTNNDELAKKIRLMRNHGLADRDTCVMYAGNCRLHTLQAVVALELMPFVHEVSEKRIKNAELYDELLADVDGVTLPPRYPGIKQVYHTYVIQVERREALKEFLAKNGVEAKVHYPVPIHLQAPYRELGYKEGDFPVCEAQAKKILSLPIHQYLTERQVRYVAGLICEFYSTKQT